MIPDGNAHLPRCKGFRIPLAEVGPTGTAIVSSISNQQ